MIKSRPWITNRANTDGRPGYRPTARRGDGRWFDIRNYTSGGTAQVYIYDEIGYWGVTAQDFAQQINALDVTEIDLRLNSPGGDAFDGIAIHNALKSHTAHVTITVDALAASAASVIAMAGDTVIMNAGAQMMIHDASGYCVGNAADMQIMVDTLNRMSDSIASFYAERAGGDVTEWRAAMQAETWYTADEAVAAGLADRTSAAAPAEPDVAARWDFSVFQHAGRANAPAPRTPAREPRTTAVRTPADAPKRPQIRPAARQSAPAPAEPPVFEFTPADIDDMALQIRDVMRTAPAPTETPPAEPEPTEPLGFVIDGIDVMNAVLAACKEA